MHLCRAYKTKKNAPRNVHRNMKILDSVASERNKQVKVSLPNLQLTDKCFIISNSFP